VGSLAIRLRKSSHLKTSKKIPKKFPKIQKILRSPDLALILDFESYIARNQGILIK
jgi:hypothetical protein